MFLTVAERRMRREKGGFGARRGWRNRRALIVIVIAGFEIHILFHADDKLQHKIPEF